MNESMSIHKTEQWILKLSVALFLSCSSTFCRLYFATYVESRCLDNIHFKKKFIILKHSQLSHLTRYFLNIIVESLVEV